MLYMISYRVADSWINEQFEAKADIIAVQRFRNKRKEIQSSRERYSSAFLQKWSNEVIDPITKQMGAWVPVINGPRNKGRHGKVSNRH